MKISQCNEHGLTKQECTSIDYGVKWNIWPNIKILQKEQLKGSPELWNKIVGKCDSGDGGLWGNDEAVRTKAHGIVARSMCRLREMRNAARRQIKKQLGTWPEFYKKHRSILDKDDEDEGEEGSVKFTYEDVDRFLTAEDSHDRDQKEIVEIKWWFFIDCILGKSRFGSNEALGDQDRRRKAKDVVKLVTPGEFAFVYIIMKYWVPYWDEEESNEDDNEGENEPMTNEPKTKKRKCGKKQGQPCFISDIVCGEYQAKMAEFGNKKADRSKVRKWNEKWERFKSGDDGGKPKSSSDQNKNKNNEKAKPMLSSSELLSFL